MEIDAASSSSRMRTGPVLPSTTSATSSFQTTFPPLSNSTSTSTSSSVAVENPLLFERAVKAELMTLLQEQSRQEGPSEVSGRPRDVFLPMGEGEVREEGRDGHPEECDEEIVVLESDPEQGDPEEGEPDGLVKEILQLQQQQQRAEMSRLTEAHAVTRANAAFRRGLEELILACLSIASGDLGNSSNSNGMSSSMAASTAFGSQESPAEGNDQTEALATETEEALRENGRRVEVGERGSHGVTEADPSVGLTSGDSPLSAGEYEEGDTVLVAEDGRISREVVEGNRLPLQVTSGRVFEEEQRVGISGVSSREREATEGENESQTASAGAGRERLEWEMELDQAMVALAQMEEERRREMNALTGSRVVSSFRHRRLLQALLMRGQEQRSEQALRDLVRRQVQDLNLVSGLHPVTNINTDFRSHLETSLSGDPHAPLRELRIARRSRHRPPPPATRPLPAPRPPPVPPPLPPRRTFRQLYPPRHFPHPPQNRGLWDRGSGESLPVVQQERMEVRLQSLENMVSLCLSGILELQRSQRQELAGALQRLYHSSPVPEEAISGSRWRLVSDGICSICCDLPIDCLLYRCGHMCACFTCATKLQQADQNCPLCRAPIHEVVRAYRTGTNY